MKKVVLLGDSIRLIGYGKPVAEALSGEFEVWQPEGNCRFAKPPCAAFGIGEGSWRART